MTWEGNEEVFWDNKKKTQETSPGNLRMQQSSLEQEESAREQKRKGD